ncbi:hypothetical protein TNIN_358121 [Trichonephila inaurata madagascariensis]|uniref:Uncharacterized protein n=1 Tax=Trichonephila inaurata madagascariensis TaxID=2747483 RepID=A0A8X7CSJ5_9ARAC|nr:hypothetical protein TNIN_358121 [Trichonephila inaurata madagascariensis]
MQLASRCLRIEMRKESGYPFRKKVSRTSPELAIEHPKEIAFWLQECVFISFIRSENTSHVEWKTPGEIGLSPYPAAELRVRPALELGAESLFFGEHLRFVEEDSSLGNENNVTRMGSIS